MTLIFQLAVLLMSVVIHEFAHGWMAFRLGDPTAEQAGRLTLNPIKHLDPIGSFLVPLLLFMTTSGQTIFGWAKPVPYNPYNLRDQKYGEAKVAIAGPAANLSVAAVFGLGLRFLPLDWFTSTNLFQPLAIIVLLNLLLAVFNLMPIPPLDGSKILFDFLPYSLRNMRIFLERYGMLILLFFIFFAFQWVFPIVFLAMRLLVGSRTMLLF